MSQGYATKRRLDKLDRKSWSMLGGLLAEPSLEGDTSSVTSSNPVEGSCFTLQECNNDLLVHKFNSRASSQSVVSLPEALRYLTRSLVRKQNGKNS